MRVEPAKQAASRTGGTLRDAAVAEHQSGSRSLVALAPAASVPSATHRQTQLPAAFLAHLIATKDLLPQTRERRRAEPGEVIAAYRAAADLMK
ncbi:MAG: hypothetical protein HY543_08770 [Deltaproteobacteria bacterium]|nr:hypothetical protein [Deltaproteobacteria bacterium]